MGCCGSCIQEGIPVGIGGVGIGRRARLGCGSCIHGGIPVGIGGTGLGRRANRLRYDGLRRINQRCFARCTMLILPVLTCSGVGVGTVLKSTGALDEGAGGP